MGTFNRTGLAKGMCFSKMLLTQIKLDLVNVGSLKLEMIFKKKLAASSFPDLLLGHRPNELKSTSTPEYWPKSQKKRGRCSFSGDQSP